MAKATLEIQIRDTGGLPPQKAVPITDRVRPRQPAEPRREPRRASEPTKREDPRKEVVCCGEKSAEPKGDPTRTERLLGAITRLVQVITGIRTSLQVAQLTRDLTTPRAPVPPPLPPRQTGRTSFPAPTAPQRPPQTVRERVERRVDTVRERVSERVAPPRREQQPERRERPAPRPPAPRPPAPRAAPPRPAPPRPAAPRAPAPRAAGVPSAVGRTASAIPGMATRAISSLARGAASAAGAVASMINPVTAAGLAVAAVGVVSVGAALGIKKFGDAMEQEARRLSKYSGELAVATSETDLRRELAQMRRARQLGPQMANLERFRSRTEDALFNIGTEIKQTLLDIMSFVQPLADVGLKILEIIPEFIALFRDSVQLIVDTLQFDFAGMKENANEIAESTNSILKKLLEKDEDVKGGDPLLDKLLAMAPNEPQPLVAGGF